MSPVPRLMMVELNEFAEPLLKRGAQELGLRNIAALLAMPRSTTSTDDRVEHQGLDPWVQWVNVHTGQPSSVHGVIRLGDTPGKLDSPQLWEVLGARGIRSGIWGAMNARRGSSDRCLFFLPDPWTFSESGSPPSLDDLLALPRYYATHYLDVSASAVARAGLRLLRYILRSGAVFGLLAQAPLMLRGMLRNGLNNAVLFSGFDLASTQFFLAMRRRYKPEFSLIFLNSIAHLQHHRWLEAEPLSRDLSLGLRAIDRVLGQLFASRQPGEALVVLNALTQRNVSREGPLVAYRQINPARFLEAIDARALRVEQLMTNDAHVFFRDAGDRDRAVALLSGASVGGKPLFQAEPDRECEEKMFYQVVLWDEIPAGAVLEVGDRALPFFDHFGVLAHRTGAHLPEGQAYSDGMLLPASLPNHAVFDAVLRHFGVEPRASAP